VAAFAHMKGSAASSIQSNLATTRSFNQCDVSDKCARNKCRAIGMVSACYFGVLDLWMHEFWIKKFACT
jgi:hypothetical protein